MLGDIMSPSVILLENASDSFYHFYPGHGGQVLTFYGGNQKNDIFRSVCIF